ncbi:MAG: TonB-dependent receptor plug domain-containing protein [Phycisphaerales bacterium]
MKQWGIVVLWVVVGGWVGAAWAEDGPATLSISPRVPDESAMVDEILVTATRGPMASFDTPYSADVIGSRQMADRAYRTVPQALRDIPGVMIQETSPGQGSPFIRGFTGRDNLMMIDGIRLNNSTNRSGPMQYWNTVDALSLERLEVVKGPGSVLYGSDAIGGTVNAITINPWSPGSSDQPIGYGARGYFRASSAERSLIGRGEVSLGYEDKLGFVGGLTAKDFGELQGGDSVGGQPHTGYEEYDADFKGEYFLNADTRLTMLHQRVRQNNVPRTHRLADAATWRGTTHGSDRRLDYDEERELTAMQFHADHIEDSFIQSLVASVSWQVASEVEDRIKSSGGESLQGFDVGTLGFFVQATSVSPIGKLTYGLDFYHDNVNSFSTTNPIQGPVADDATYDLLGVFVQDQIDLAERLTLILGGRFTFAAADAGHVDDPSDGVSGVGDISLSDQWTNASGSARLNYQLVPDQLNIYGGISQAFRAPNIEDLTSLTIQRSGEQAIPSPGLEPETYLAYEVGLKARNQRFTAEIAYYYTMIFDPVVVQPTGGISPGGDVIVAKTNAGRGYVNGIEAGAAYEVFDHVQLFGNIAWQEGEIEDDYLSRVMPLTGQIGVRVESAKRDLWAEIQMVTADKADKLSSADRSDTQRIPPGGTPGYAVVHLRGGWKVCANATLYAAVENIADADYRVHGSGSNMPGRNFIFGLEVKF